MTSSILEVTKMPSSTKLPQELLRVLGDDRQMGHFNQVAHLSKATFNLLEIHVISSVDTSESKQQNYGQI